MRLIPIGLWLGVALLVVACDRGQGAADRETTAPAVEAASHGKAPVDGQLEAGQGTPEPQPDTPPPEEAPVVVEDLPWDDPRAIALEVLGRCKGSDPARLVSVATEVNRRHALDVKQGQSVCEAIFGRDSWRNTAVKAWDGEIRAVRVRGDTARAMFHDLGGGEVAVVSLSREEGRWRFDDIHSPDRTSYESWGEPLEIPTSR